MCARQDYGGAVEVNNNSSFFATSDTFTSDVAAVGGAIEAKQNSTVAVARSVFVNDVAGPHAGILDETRSNISESSDVFANDTQPYINDYYEIFGSVVANNNVFEDGAR